MSAYLEEIKFNERGLVPVVTIEAGTSELLMVAWANKEAIAATVEEKRAVYWSRSRTKIWRKGEESGNVQKLVELRLDCDNDTVCYIVDQIGGADATQVVSHASSNPSITAHGQTVSI